jgi:hypothetical protein
VSLCPCGSPIAQLIATTPAGSEDPSPLLLYFYEKSGK